MAHGPPHVTGRPGLADRLRRQQDSPLPFPELYLPAAQPLGPTSEPLLGHVDITFPGGDQRLTSSQVQLGLPGTKHHHTAKNQTPDSLGVLASTQATQSACLPRFCDGQTTDETAIRRARTRWRGAKSLTERGILFAPGVGLEPTTRGLTVRSAKAQEQRETANSPVPPRVSSVHQFSTPCTSFQ